MSEIPEGRRSLPAGALESGSPLATGDSTPRGAALGRVVHCKREKYDVYIGRPGDFGNPFRVDGGRAEAIANFEDYARRRIAVDFWWADKVKALHGKVLGCWCAPQACHGDVLLKLAAELATTSTTADR